MDKNSTMPELAKREGKFFNGELADFTNLEVIYYFLNCKDSQKVLKLIYRSYGGCLKSSSSE